MNGDVSARDSVNNTWYPTVKRVSDLLAATILLILLSPVMAVVALLIRLRMGYPVFFRQERAGLHGQPFELVKFRSMRDAKRADGTELTEAERITTLGRILRKTSLDELPQLWNVIKGDMSLVGPRPLYVDYLNYYTEREHMRHWVRPGITGLAQVSGRNYLTWDARLELDAQYVESLSLRNDMKILMKTVLKVVSGSDVTVVPGEARMLLSDERYAMNQNDAKLDSAEDKTGGVVHE